MAAVQCTRCTAERKGFRRELDAWRHRLIHCVGFESILEGIYGPLLLKDLHLFNDCEPEEVDDWSPESSRSFCSFCNLSLDKLSDQAPAATSPLSSPSNYSPCQTSTISESSQSAHKFLQAVYHNKDVTLDCDSNIPLVAQELMKKMIRQFAVEYASKCLLRSGTNGVTRPSSPISETSDGPLDLTVSRTVEEKEICSEPDGVLDLSNRNSSSSSTLSSSNQKATGFRLPLVTEGRGGVGQRGTKTSTLDAVLHSLCPAHRSLLYQILKLAHQENLLLFHNHKPVDSTESLCCHCSASSQENSARHSVLFVECKAHNRSICCPSADCNHRSHCSLSYHPVDSKSSCTTHQRPFKDIDGQRDPNCSCVQRCRLNTYSPLCSKRLHCNSCQNLAAGHINNTVSSFKSSPILSQTSLCPSSSRLCSSVCYEKNSSCSCCTQHACSTQHGNTGEFRDEDHFTTLNRGLSPPPPSLSPIPSDISKKPNEKPPSLFHHRQGEETDLANKNRPVSSSHVTAGVDTENELPCKMPDSRMEQNTNGTILQDVMSRFSQKLDNITPVENDPTLVSTAIYVSEKEQQFPSTSQNLSFHADSHLTEIITTVLHTGNASDYNLSELFTRHDDREPKSPNTRARCRQKIQIAIATPTDNASARRHTLEIKRKLAMLDSSYKRRKVPQAKKARLKDGRGSITTSGSLPDSNVTKEMSKKEAQVVLEPAEDMITEVILSTLSAEHQREDVQENVEAVVVTEELLIVNGEKGGLSHKQNKVANIQHTSEQQNTTRKQGPKGDHIEIEMAACSANTAPSPCKEGCTGSSVSTDGSHEAAPLGQNPGTDNTPEKASHSTVKDGYKVQSNQSKEKRRSVRNIVPPQRFNSYVTWHAPIFNVLNKDADTDDTQPKGHPAGKLAFQTKREPSDTEPKDQTHSFVSTMLTKEESSDKHSKIDTNGSDCGTHRRLRSTTKKLQESEFSQSPLNNGTNIQPACPASSPSPQVEYISPIKLMFVSQVKDKEGVKYSLKSARSGFSTHAEVYFDPCEESSWSGMPQKHKSRRKEGAVSPVKPVLTSLKSVSLPTSPSSPPQKTASLSSKPAKSTFSSSKSATSPSKSASPLKSSPRRSTRSPAKCTSPSPKSASSSKKSISSPSETLSPLASSLRKSPLSPAKSTSPSPKSASSSKKFICTGSPVKSASSPRSVSLSPKNSSRRSSNSTPTKRLSESESHRSPGDLPCETTPPKRRPGRPKKLGPQPEQKVKRPIGRPPKQKTEGAVVESKSLNGNGIPEDDEDNIVKNLKITVLYGRSRKNKRVVSEGCSLIPTHLSGDCHAVEVKRNLATLLHSSKNSSSGIKTALEELNFVSPAKEFASQSGGNIKCQKKAKSAPMRKPGRPAKVKISGISVTVTTASPLQRKILMNKDNTPHSSEIQLSKKALLPDFKSAGEPCTVSNQTTTKSNQTKEVMGTKTKNKSELPSQPIAVRHSIRDRKPSIHFLHAVATSSSRSYSCSSALLRRSKKLLLNKVSSERKQEQLSVGSLGEKRQLCGQKRESVAKDLSRVAKVSLDSIFCPKETVRWWISSAEEKTVNQELARRIQVISDTWVSDTANNQGKETSFHKKIDTKENNSLTRKAKKSSAVRTLFECSPNKPRSCSMQQICSWFMQTTETQSLAIVKKASSRNPYELMHFSRSAIKQSIGYSPQAERLRKHIKKFAKTVPKSPLQHWQAQKRLRKKNACKVRRQLFVSRFSVGWRNQQVMWWRCTLSGRFWATLIRARTRFLTRKQRESRQKKQKHKTNKGDKGYSNRPLTTGLKSNRKALHRSAKAPFSNCVSSFPSTSGNQSKEHGDKQEQKLCSKAWSPETLKECRVFLRKINSPSNESAEEWDSCTVTLDDGSPSTRLFAGEKRELEGVVKAVKSKRSMNKKTASRVLAGPGPKSAQNQDVVQVERQRGKHKHPGVVPPELPQQPPAKMLRQSRMRGLSGPRWCDFVFDN